MKRFFLFLSLIICVVAKEERGENSINAKDHIKFDFDGPFTITYRITSTSSNIDVYLMPHPAYVNWKESSFSNPVFIKGASKIGTQNAHVKDFYVDSGDEFHLVIYNPSLLQSVYVEYDIFFKPTEEPLPTWAIVSIVSATIVVIVGLISIGVHVFKRKHPGDREMLLG